MSGGSSTVPSHVQKAGSWNNLAFERIKKKPAQRAADGMKLQKQQRRRSRDPDPAESS